MRIPLPGRVWRLFVIGIAGWSATLTSNAPSLTKAASVITVSLSPAHGGVTLKSAVAPHR